MWVRSLGQEDPLEEETATHSSIIAWKIPWTEESGGLQSDCRVRRVGHRSARARTHTHTHTHTHLCLFRLQCVDSKEAVDCMALKVRDYLSLS